MKILIVISIILFSFLTLAHQDFTVTKKFGNITTMIKTGYQYEEIKKVEIIGQLAQVLSKKFKYKKPIFLDFIHEYTGNEGNRYFLSFDDGEKFSSSVLFGKRKETSDKKKKLESKVVIRAFADNFEIINVLKLLEYAIKNDKGIESRQSEIEHSTKFITWILKSISKKNIKNILKKENSSILNKVINNKIDRPRSSYYELRYYWQNDEFYVVNREDIILALYNIYNFKRLGTATFIFDEENSFYFIDNSSLETKVSKKQIINNNDNSGPPIIKYIGNEKYIINFRSMFVGKDRILLYLKDKDMLIQDLEKIISPK